MRARLLASSEVDETGCLIYSGYVGTHGYGQIGFDKRVYRAHRFSWEAWRGEIPPGLHVLHSCDTRACINVDHLFLGTQAQNMRDMIEKGRAVHATRKLTPDQRAEVVRRYRSRWGHWNPDGESSNELAQEFGVSRAYITQIVREEFRKRDKIQSKRHSG